MRDIANQVTSSGSARRPASGWRVEDLNDIDYGAWQGKTHDEVRESSPIEYQRWQRSPHLMRLPAGESLQQLAARVADALRFAIQHHPDDTIVMVGHDSSNRVLLLQALDLPLSAFWRISQDTCAINDSSAARPLMPWPDLAGTTCCAVLSTPQTESADLTQKNASALA